MTEDERLNQQRILSSPFYRLAEEDLGFVETGREAWAMIQAFDK